MRSTLSRSVLLSAATAFLGMLIAQACGGSASAATDASDPVEGVWDNAVTLKDCSTGATPGTALGTAVYHRGGTITDTAAAPPTSRGPGFGKWEKTASGYLARIRAFRYNADGTLAGSSKLTRTFTLSSDGNSQTSSNTLELLDPTGAVVATRCSSETSQRLY